MIFSQTPLQGAFLIGIERHSDERGFFARTWCQREMEAHGLETRFVQCSISFNKSAGTLRGLHFQAKPHEEVKLLRCTKGSVFDVIVDLRPDSATFTQHFAATLTAGNRDMLYVPRGFAHGFQTLEDETEVLYQISEFYEPASARGIRWDDPAFGIVWPHVDERIMNDRDRSYPDFQSAARGIR